MSVLKTVGSATLSAVLTLPILGIPLPEAHASTSCTAEDSKFVEDFNGDAVESYGTRSVQDPPYRSITSCGTVVNTAHEAFSGTDQVEMGYQQDANHQGTYRLFFEYQIGGATYGAYYSSQSYSVNTPVWLMARVETKGATTWDGKYSFDGSNYVYFWSCVCAGYDGVAESEVSRHLSPDWTSDIYNLYQLDYFDYHWYAWTGIHCDLRNTGNYNPTDWDADPLSANEWLVVHQTMQGSC